jgi:hypothetical protein
MIAQKKQVEQTLKEVTAFSYLQFTIILKEEDIWYKRYAYGFSKFKSHRNRLSMLIKNNIFIFLL